VFSVDSEGGKWFLGVVESSNPSKRKAMKSLKTKIAKDGKVTFWSTYEQQWKCVYASLILDRDLATLTQQERNRIAKAATVECRA
jgi:hypothetical protein